MPRRDMNVLSGYPPDSKSVEYLKPKWGDSWHIPEQPGGLNKGAHVYVGSDYCLYNADMATQYNMFSTFELHTTYSLPFTLNRRNRKPNFTLTYGYEI